MPSVTRCPECNGQLQVPEEFFGRKVKCPTCGAQFTARADGSTGPTAPPPPAAPSPRWEDDEGDYEDDPRPRRRRPRGNYEPHRGTTILVLGILSIVICSPLGPFAWIMGNGDMQKIRSGLMDPEGEGTTQAGRICGIIGTVFLILGCLYAVFVMVVFAGARGGAFR